MKAHAVIVTHEPSHVEVNRVLQGEQSELHETVNHGHKEYVRGEAHTNTIEGYWSHLKKGLDAIYIHVSKKHLQKYCDEYAYRYNS